jgi:hypothetical protein
MTMAHATILIPVATAETFLRIMIFRFLAGSTKSQIASMVFLVAQKLYVDARNKQQQGTAADPWSSL